MLRLVSAMEQVFLERHQVSAQLVADMHLYVYKRVGVVGLHPDIAIERTRDAVVKDLLFHCLVRYSFYVQLLTFMFSTFLFSPIFLQLVYSFTDMQCVDTS